MAHDNPDEIDLSEDELQADKDVEVDEEAAMAATMGFTSFGGARPTDDDTEANRPPKKRRFNHGLDEAVVAHSGGENYSGSVADNEAFATSANAVITGPRSQSQSQSQNRPLSPSSHSLPPNPHGLPSRPPPVVSAAAAQIHQQPPFHHHGGQAHHNQPHNSLPTGGHNSRSHGGQQNPLWYINYYDHSSNRNPWEELEQLRGLAPVGSWIAFSGGGDGARGRGGRDGGRPATAGTEEGQEVDVAAG
ncbi:uncharacterized protein C8A04DRAFT_39612 [Dichotomopilus funicola]|uniref:Uncharacterized protein n=1 Tax=Dichotomopilus funicola TaxID=1934379 RepID=A0AAN6UX76_9PEZI|nr:hypothetical protein C8A04DRAFT_39612 [Dichotomopilus funicola]